MKRRERPEVEWPCCPPGSGAMDIKILRQICRRDRYRKRGKDGMILTEFKS